MHDWKMELYWRLPVRAQEAVLGLYAGRLDRLYYGDGYEAWRNTFRHWQQWSFAEAKSWQAQQLQTMIELAATRVPYYRATWRGLNWKAVRSPAELAILPLLDKQSLRQNEQQFLVDGMHSKSLWQETTSGTTGGAVRIYWPKTMLPKWWALMEVIVRNSSGVAREMPRAMMGSRVVVRGNERRGPYWRFNRRWRQLYLSSYHVSTKTVAGYVDALRYYGSEWITGFGSAIAALAESALVASLPPVSMRACIVSGDTLSPAMRSSIEGFFGCKCFDSYGQQEAVSLAMECSQGRMHVVPMVGILEILRPDGEPCVVGEIGELVATGLLNDAMPLVRYRLGDYAAWAEDTICSCGNPQPAITALEGRVDDYLLTISGKRVGRLAAFRRCPSIHAAQLVQDSLTHAYLLVRPGRNYRHRDALMVRDDIASRVGEIAIDVAEVEEIPRTPQGKIVSVVRLFDRPEMRRTYDELLRDNTMACLEHSDGGSGGNGYRHGVTLQGTKVVVITSGHDVTDPRIYSKLACSLRHLGASVTVVGKLEGRDPGSVRIRTVPKPSSRLVRFLWQPWRCVWAARHLDADIIHFHDAEMLMVLPVARLWWWRAKFVYDVHEDFANLMLVRDWLPAWIKPLVRSITNFAEKGLARLADAVVGVTPPLTAKFSNREKITAYNYVAQKFFDESARMSRQPADREFDVAHIGTLNSTRAGFLTEVLREFHRLRPKARSVLIVVPHDIEITMRMQVPEGCTVLGKIPHEQIPAWLGNSKVGLDVHPWLGPHLKVALPMKVCEYMAAGCAVVSSSMPVLDEVLTGAPSQALKLIDGGEPRDYASAIVELLENIDRGMDARLRLLEFARCKMVWENEADKIAQLYTRLAVDKCDT